MSGKPYQSILIPYEDEILALRHRLPMSYAQIAAVLLQKYQLNVCRETIFKFIKVRSRGRKVYCYARSAPGEKSTSVLATPQLADPRKGSPRAVPSRPSPAGAIGWIAETLLFGAP